METSAAEVVDEEVTVEEETYFYSAAERCFYTKIARDGKTRYVIVDAPLGALVDALPKDAAEYDDDGEKVYQLYEKQLPLIHVFEHDH